MKRRNRLLAARRRRAALLRRPARARRGSTLMIVIVLLALLSVLGVLFYSFAAQERSNSEYYSSAAKVVEDPGLSADVLMDWGLQQLVVSTDPRLKNSALWGSRHSLLATSLGVNNHRITDLAAFNGQGVHIASEDANNNGTLDMGEDQNGNGFIDFFVDQNGNGLADDPTINPSEPDNRYLLRINTSPAANNLNEADTTNNWPQPDAGYTYPDVNNAFLAYTGWTLDPVNGFLRPVVIPSFHRPQLLRINTSSGGQQLPPRYPSGSPTLFWYNFTEDTNHNGQLDGGEDINGDGVLDSFGPRMFRPHPDHQFVPPGNQSGTVSLRFILDAADASQYSTTPPMTPFPFQPIMPNGYSPAADWVGHQGVWSGLHPNYSGSTYNNNVARNDEYQFDADNDGDGIREGVWVDLDFPVQEDASGNLFVPLFSFTVYDLDALFNANAHGNLARVLHDNVPLSSSSGNPFGYNDFISKSNNGVTPAEVNPIYGLNARPGIEGPTPPMGGPPPYWQPFTQHGFFFGNYPVNAASLGMSFQGQYYAWVESGNMEFVFMKLGRPEVNTSTNNIDDLYSGLFGEEHLIYQNYGSRSSQPAVSSAPLPRPGTSVADDNGNFYEGVGYPPQFWNDAPNQHYLDVDQPRDLTGLGTYLDTEDANRNGMLDAGEDANGNGVIDLYPKRLRFLVNTGFRVPFLQYDKYHSNQTGTSGNVNWQKWTANLPSGGGSQSLMSNIKTTGGLDEPNEVALYAEDGRDVDEPFGADEMLYLQLSNADVSRFGVTSRLASLLPFNFSTNATLNSRGQQIRRMFTTVSNDRKTFNLPRGSTTLPNPGIANQIRPWEFNLDTYSNSPTQKFPPQFGTVRRYATNDPFRAPVRYLLEMEQNGTTTNKLQQRLDITRLLTVQGNQPFYRDLTLHPVDPGSATIPTTPPSYPPSSVAAQEYWARKDRQQLARDIYVLLYLLGGGYDTTTQSGHTSAVGTYGTTGDNSGRNIYSDEQLEQMARFAVNLVDAQDRDNVITRFEYDTNLADGWNLDDNPYTVDSGATDRAEVWGVERQELAFSEVIALRSTADASNRTFTMHDDTSEHRWVAVELRNLAPYPVYFSDRQEWQIRMVQAEDSNDAGYVAATAVLNERRVNLKKAAGFAPAGGFYTLFSTDTATSAPMGFTASAFAVDNTGSGSPGSTNWIVPNDSSFAASASANGNHIDLVEDQVTNGQGVKITDGSSPPNDLTGTPGALLQDTMTGPGSFNLNTTSNVRFILRRRAHPTRSAPTSTLEEADNPYVDVDRMAAEPLGSRTFDLSGGASQTNIETQLDSLQSKERREVLDGFNTNDNTNVAAHKPNTFGAGAAAENSLSGYGTGGTFAYWQAHFDRPFQSVVELFNIPLVGPPAYTATTPSVVRKDGLTSYFAGMFKIPSQQYSCGPGGTNDLTNYAKSAAGMFLLPTNPNGGATVADNNRWHRLLEIVDVGSSTHRNLGIGTDFTITRIPGKLNLNSIRHPEVLAGLIDDARVASLNLGTYGNASRPALNDVFEGATRDWFAQLQRSRDGLDPLWLTASQNAGQSQGLFLPGMPGSKPFRPLSYTGHGTSSVEHTVLRSLPLDTATPKRGLFDVATNAELSTDPPLHPLLRNRILSKMFGNSTTRSNTFVAFISVKLFRAVADPTTGAIRIGGPVDTNAATTALPEYRGFFVIDRSLLEKGYQSGGGGFNSFRPFVTYRKILEEP